MERNEYLEKLELLMQDGDIWLSSLDLANISERNHFHVLRDIREDIESGVIKTLNTLSTQSKFGLSSNENLMNFLKETLEYIERLDFSNVITESIRKIKVIETQRITDRGRVTYFLLNKEAALMCLMRYSPEIRMIVSSLFFKSVEMMREKGYNISSLGEYYDGMEEEIKDRIEMFEDDLKEDGVLDDFSFNYILRLSFEKFPKEMDKYYEDNFPQYKKMKKEVYYKSDTGLIIEGKSKPIIGKNIKKK